jgi:hypothetical protein
MRKNKNLGEGGVEERRPSALERLREEITVLRIEGTLFCFDPKLDFGHLPNSRAKSMA